MVTVTVLVNGSACSSQACSSRSLGAEEGGRGAEERLEDRELLDRKVQLPPIAGGRAPQRVKLDPGRAQDPAPGGRLAAREGADARDQLGEMERLGQVIVGTQAQAADPLPGRAGRGQHEHHDPVVPLGDHLTQGVAMDSRQVAVEHHHVVGVELELGRGLQPVVGGIDGHALVAQALDQHVGQRPGVLHHQDPHAGTPAGTASVASGSVMATRRPPPGLACRSRVPRWAEAMAATIDSPSPAPSSEPVRSARSRRNG